jgi:hypothetical protein
MWRLELRLQNGGTGRDADTMRSSETRRRLEYALEFELQQLQLLEQQVAAKPLADPVQVANWPGLVASHQQSIAFYRARLADIASNGS